MTATTPTPEDSVAEACRLHEEALALAAAGQLEPARAACARALALLESAVGADHPDVANVLNALGSIVGQQGDLDRAGDCFRRAARICRQEDEPIVARIRVQALVNLGSWHAAAGRYGRAWKLLRRALALARSRLGADDLDTASVLNGLGMLCKHTGRFALGRRCYRRALAVFQTQLGPDHP